MCQLPIDLGGSIVTGITAGALVRLRWRLGLEGLKVYDVFQMRGGVAMDLVQHFDIDVLPGEPEAIAFPDLRRRDYKPRHLFDGTEVFMPGAFEAAVSPNGDWLLHKDGDVQNLFSRLVDDRWVLFRPTRGDRLEL